MPKTPHLLVDVRLLVAQGGGGGTQVAHANGPAVVLHHKDVGQLVQAGHIEGLQVAGASGAGVQSQLQLYMLSEDFQH
eukprot:scaffold132268_cov20-Tisochrysis_lutea.AAC.4